KTDISTASETSCDLCGGTDFTILSTTDRHAQPLQSGLCSGCGLVMHLPVPSEDEVAEYYASRYRRDYHGERIPNPRRVMRAWNNGERIHALLAPYLEGGESIFEIGAGIGCTVKVFETHGHQAAGIEPNRDFNSYSRQQLHADIANTNLYDLQDAESANLMLLIHVIEHFSSPRRALKHIHSLLADNGLFYVECPNLSGPFATLDRMFHYAHIYNFTPETLQALARECGFTPLATFSHDDSPDIHILFRKAKAESAVGELVEYAQQVQQSVQRHNALTYHLRPIYLIRRLRKLCSYLVEAISAKSFVRRLLARLKKESK
ncbi:MAG: class I SAM-dependent methyltransferase, partial [Mariprofundaceae bacterium]|nr:class I SAM-dependent methyltransferase [Mariprofundaceae bacterium]